MASRLDDVNAYASKGIQGVKGWCVPQLWQAIWPLSHKIGDGPVAEIGVFEGKFMIGLCKTFGASPASPSAAIDVFDLQQFNLDGAGVGKIAVFKDNLARHGVAPGAVDIVKADSLSLRQSDAETLLAGRDGYHFFSVDGCHEVVHTINDIEFAMKVTANHGIIAVDDYTNPNWPGVMEAVARLYLMGTPRFVPLAFICNKLLLCSYSYHAVYLEAVGRYVAEHHPSTRVKKCKRFGHDTLSILPVTATWSDLAPI